MKTDPATQLPECHEGAEAFTRFRNVMKAVLAVPNSEIQKRIAEHRKEVDANPHRRGPKRKTNKPSASRVPHA